jgi:glycosyltransferase involved in cell wall biosynthesis
MNIAMVITSLDNKGPIVMLRTLVGRLVLSGFKCTIYYFDDLHAIQFPCETRRIKFLEPFDFGKYELIHSHLFRPDLYCAYHHSAIRKSNVKLISTVHTAIYDDLEYTYGKFTSRLIVPLWQHAWKKMDHIVLLSDFARQYYANENFKAVTVISNGVDLPEYYSPIPDDDERMISEFKTGKILLGTVCAMDKRKGLEQVISLLKMNNNYAFLIVGDGTEKTALEALAKKYAVADRFKVIGFRVDGYRYMSYFDIFVLPSRSEGMPMALLEAMSLKVPVVCSEIPSLIQISIKSEVGLFKLDDIGGFDRVCQKMAINLKKSSHCSYTGIQMAVKYIDLYDSLSKIS